MAFLKRLIRALPLLVLSPFLMAISFLALVLVQLFTRRGGKILQADVAQGEPSGPVPAVSGLRTPDLVEPGVTSLSTGQWYAHRRPGDSGKHFCPASAYVPLNERCCKMLRRLIRELFPAITTVTIGRCEEWVSLSSSTARSSGATSGVRRPVSTHLGGRRQA